jgi:formiminotetrahydrofolate cyclodeaminase
LCAAIDRIGLAASRSDIGVGAQMARAAGAGAYQNVCINLPGLTDKAAVRILVARADRAWAQVCDLHQRAEKQILDGLRAAVPA